LGCPDMTSNQTNHICVCVCTYKRPHLLKRLLEKLGNQDTNGEFTYSIVIADNDHLKSAEAVVQEFAANSAVHIKYCVEPRQNIALARNKAIENADGDYVAFLDDDEFPTKQWLLTLYRACREYDVDGVLGPVKPHFDVEPPRWVIEGKFYERPTYPTGFVIDWRKGRTGNVLLRKRVFRADVEPFRQEFLTGEDQDFFRRMIEAGYSFIWCNEAVAYEVVPPLRWKRTFMLRRALLRGAISLVHPTTKVTEIVKSLIAVAVYVLLAPFTFLAGQHLFIKILIKLFDHIGRLLAVVGIHLVQEPYVIE
jgi:succinoglycan biosynthesis protein ExoM